MRRLFKINPYILIFILFSLWRIYLCVLLKLSILFIPLEYKDRFLGGGPLYHSVLPEIFSWANFDGEHYLSIAIFGYKTLEQAFFPIYPLLINVITGPFRLDLYSSLLSATLGGILISNVAFLFALFILFKLIKEDYSNEVGAWTILLLLAFPTSFYFGSVYSESLYLLLSVSSFYFARKGKWPLAGVLGMVASATRVFGIVLFPALLIEAWQQKNHKAIAYLLLIPLGLIGYMLYQWVTVNDPLAFYHLQQLVGEQHQSGIVLLPQVYYRYVKILLETGLIVPIYQTMVLEFFIGILFLAAPLYGYTQGLRLAYVFYALIGFLLPSIQGSFSSIPRYVIVLFPSFIAIALFVCKFPNWIRILIIVGSVIWLSAETILFLRGYWVA